MQATVKSGIMNAPHDDPQGIAITGFQPGYPPRFKCKVLFFRSKLLDDDNSKDNSLQIILG